MNVNWRRGIFDRACKNTFRSSASRESEKGAQSVDRMSYNAQHRVRVQVKLHRAFLLMLPCSEFHRCSQSLCLAYSRIIRADPG